MSYLILVRHGRSEWNEKGLWTGWADPSLNDVGIAEAHRAAEALKGFKIDIAYTSLLKRAQETLDIILSDLKISPPITENQALNERSYGIYTGKNKWQIQKEVGEEIFRKIRRSWDYPIPEGESLKMVYERVIPFYEKEISPKIASGQNAVISASGNSLRALVKYLEDIPDDKISEVEFGTAEVWIYEIGVGGKIISKEIRAKNSAKV